MDHLAEELSFFNFDDLPPTECEKVEGILRCSTLSVKLPDLPSGDQSAAVADVIHDASAFEATFSPLELPPSLTMIPISGMHVLAPSMPLITYGGAGGSYGAGIMMPHHPPPQMGAALPLQYLITQPPPPMVPVPPIITEPPPPHGYPPPPPLAAEAPAKPYERRNKKRRPADYYDRLEARQRQAETTAVNGCDAAASDTQPAEMRCLPNNVFLTGPGPLPIDPAALPHQRPTLKSLNEDSTEELRPCVEHLCPAQITVQEAHQTDDASVSTQIYSDASRTNVSEQSDPTIVNGVPFSPEPAEPAPIAEPAEPAPIAEPAEPAAVAEPALPTPSVEPTVSAASAEPGVSAANVDATVSCAAPSKAPVAASWAGLFRGRKSDVVFNSVSNGQPSSEHASVAAPPTDDIKVVSVGKDKEAKNLAVLLKTHTLCHKPVSLMPRGLHNKGNWCYVNATLQALLACPPFYHLMKSLPDFPALARGPSSTPVIDCLVEFVNAFSTMQYKPLEKSALNAKGTVRQDIQTGIPFEPTYVYKMLHVIKNDTGFQHGRQEDAEEFLSCLLNALHDEMLASLQTLQPPSEELPPSDPVPEVNGDGEEQEEGWEQVGPKNKSVLTREAKFKTSPVSAMMRGQLRSVLHKTGARESATLEPFFSLQLDIQGKDIRSVEDALGGLTSRETLHGFTCSKTKQEVDATQRLLLEELPPVLILHLKWFSYDKSGGIQKNVKQVDFAADLEINKDLLSANAKSRLTSAQRKYKLFAVVNHLGGRAIGGHYITDVFHPGINSWVRCDDSHVYSLPLSKVLKYVSPKVPYLLYYRRLDLN